MSDFFKEFQSSSKAEWQNKIVADLKGKDPSLLQISDEIEELNLSSYLHREDGKNQDQIPGNFPFTRGMNRDNNHWANGALIQIEDEKSANKKALNILGSGGDLLVFKSHKENTDWKLVMNEIQVEHIQIQFVIQSIEEFKEILNLGLPKTMNVRYNIDFLNNWNEDDFSEIATNFKDQQQRFCSVNGFKTQQCGANTWQEIAFCLSAGHEYLVKLLGLGFNIDEAAACISFNLGIGSNYFNETAKFRAFRTLWSKIIKAYQPEHNCSYNCTITAVATHVNKSLIDPYTNLLRQTTEAMSAINAGIDGLVILPYDLFSTEGASDLSERMALNISSILKEESYFDKVLDPIGGSYSVEAIGDEIGKKAWSTFQKMDSEGGIFSSKVLGDFVEDVHSKRALRISKFQDGSIVGIGVNKYSTPSEAIAKWLPATDYLGMTPVILENEYKAATV
ncbi:MAG: methylmalonyl-CoA mutase family protein [Crocinitomicaceae bacterium]|nr:methylmalonyl-CoA mutase family protein [Crocinitomicaceae bacterium]